MKSWKTTLGGLFSAAGAGMAGQQGWMGAAGQILSVIGPILLGLAAKDVNVTGGTVRQ